MSLWPKLEIDPIGDALDVIEDFYRRTQRKPDELLCSPDYWAQLQKVGVGYIQRASNGTQRLAGAVLVCDPNTTGFEAKLFDVVTG